jgi:hypothetical protein
LDAPKRVLRSSVYESRAAARAVGTTFELTHGNDESEAGLVSAMPLECFESPEQSQRLFFWR